MNWEGAPAPCRLRLTGIGAIAIGFLLLFLSGCGSDLGATDGGVPLGLTREVLSGTVVEAANPNVPVPSASLTLAASDGSSYFARADLNGSYSFTGLSAGPATLTVSPPEGSPLAPQALSVEVSDNGAFTVVAALSTTANYQSSTSVSVTAKPTSLHVGHTAVIDASVLGLPAGIHPSLVVHGGIGQVSPLGFFQASRAGSGYITAVFGSRAASAPIVVLP